MRALPLGEGALQLLLLSSIMPPACKGEERNLLLTLEQEPTEAGEEPSVISQEMIEDENPTDLNRNNKYERVTFNRNSLDSGTLNRKWVTTKCKNQKHGTPCTT